MVLILAYHMLRTAGLSIFWNCVYCNWSTVFFKCFSISFNLPDCRTEDKGGFKDPDVDRGNSFLDTFILEIQCKILLEVVQGKFKTYSRTRLEWTRLQQTQGYKEQKQAFGLVRNLSLQFHANNKQKVSKSQI